MQAALPSGFDFLNLADPAALFEHPPEGVDGTAIRQALDRAQQQVSQTPVAGQRLWILAEAGRILLADPAQYAAAIHLTRTAAPDLADSPALAHVRLIALGRLQRISELIAEVERLADLAPVTPNMSFVLKSVTAAFRLRLSLMPTVALCQAIWGDLPENLLQKLESLRSDPGPVMPVP